MTITLLDLILLAVMLVSAALAMVRGFTREVLSIASWVAAAAATVFFFEPARAIAREHIHFNPPQIADVVAAGSIFLVVLLVVSFITMKISDAILDSRVGPIDRILGFVFGAARGLLLVVVAFMFFTWLVPEKGQPEWFRTAQSKPILQDAGDKLLALLPEDPESTILQKLKRRDGAGGDAANPAAPATPDAAAPAPDESQDVSPADKQGLDKLLEQDGKPKQ
ncbi:MAG TPA: CvpA family protein [Hansschlegelia sp.]